MEIKGEANAFKLDVAKNLKQLSENAEIVIGKKEENNTTEVKIEDKSKHLTINLSFVLIGSVPTEQVTVIAERVKEVISEQSEITKASGDAPFESYLSQGIGVLTATVGTANALVVQNADYLLTGEPKPVFIMIPGALPLSVAVNPPTIITK